MTRSTGVAGLKVVALAAAASLLALAALATLAEAGPSAPTCQGQEASKARFIGSEEGETIRGTNGDDVIIGGGGYDTIDARGGDDLVCGDHDTWPFTPEEDGNTLIGGSGRDMLIGDHGPDELSGGDGNDDLRSVDPELEDGNYEPLQNILKGGDGNDQLRAGGAGDILKGGDGKDFLDGGPGEDDLFGGRGNDIDRSTDGEILYGLVGGLDEDDLDGGAGEDGLIGGDLEGLENTFTAGDTLTGGSGNDDLDGGFGADSLDGGSGVDKLYGREGNDTIFGEEGNDIIVAGPADQGLHPDLDTVRGGPGKDTIEGGAEYDQLYGDGDNDDIAGEEGDDTLRGGGGSDDLDGGPDTDDCDGGGQAGDTEQNCEAAPVTITSRSASVHGCGSGDNGETGGSAMHRPALPIAGEWIATSVNPDLCPSSAASATQTSDVQTSSDGSDWIDVDLGISNTASVWVVSQHRAHFFVGQPSTLTCTGSFTNSAPTGGGMIIWLDTGGTPEKELLTAYNSQAIDLSRSFSPGAAHTLWIRANNGGAFTGTASVDVTCDFDERVAIDAG